MKSIFWPQILAPIVGAISPAAGQSPVPTSPLAPLSPKNYVEYGMDTTSPSFKTYYDELSGNLIQLDLDSGFLYRNPGTKRLEAVLKEAPNEENVMLPLLGRIASYGDGIPESLRQNFTKVITPTTSSDYITVKTADTSQTISYVPSESILRKSPATQQWEAVIREPPSQIARKFTTAGSSLGEQLAKIFIAQIAAGMSAIQENRKEAVLAAAGRGIDPKEQVLTAPQSAPYRNPHDGLSLPIRDHSPQE